MFIFLRYSSSKDEKFSNLLGYLSPIPYDLKEQENNKFYNHDKENINECGQKTKYAKDILNQNY